MIGHVPHRSPRAANPQSPFRTGKQTSTATIIHELRRASYSANQEGRHLLAQRMADPTTATCSDQQQQQQSTSVYPDLSAANYGSTGDTPTAPSPPIAMMPQAASITAAPLHVPKSATSSSLGGKAIMPTSQIEMTISCRNLLNKDILSKSDPYCLVLMKDSWQEKFYELGRTETIQDSLSPEFVKKFIIDYNFETIQRVRIEVYDLDPTNILNPDGKDFLGYHETTLAEIVSFASRQYVRRLQGNVPGKKNFGEIILVAEEISTCKQLAQLQFSAENLPRAFCGLFRPDPFLVISRSNEDGTFSVVWKSEPVRTSRSPTWLPINMRVRTLCNGDYERTIKIDCVDSRTNGKHVLIGSIYTSFRELITDEQRNTDTFGPNSAGQNLVLHSANKRFQLQAPRDPTSHSPFQSAKSKSQRRTSSKDQFDSIRTPGTKTKVPVGDVNQPSVGSLILREISVTEELSFIDYVKSGTQLHFAVAIDFTASNGPPRDPHSLHFLDVYGGKPNAYEIALRAVGDIIQQYDSDCKFPAFGFGAKLPPTGEVSHQFSLNGNPYHPYCSSISEIITHYRSCLEKLTLYGPTNFSLVIRNTSQIASKFQDGKHYFILLIITDGILSDIHQTKNAIIDASSLPLSIIIVGVGNADFSAMDELDSDDIRLSVDGHYAARDIVQFVPLNKFLSKQGPYIRSQADLAREVLAEIPDQMIGYMKSKGFAPTMSKDK